jgi:hypothetical protein
MKLFTLAAITLLGLIPQTVIADFRCPTTGRIVKVGMNAYEVETNCGAPAAKADLTTAGALAATPKIEEWTYDFGASQFIRKLRFEGGVLKSVTNGQYGSKIPVEKQENAK